MSATKLIVKDVLEERHFAFCIPDGTWCVYKTAESDAAKVFDRLTRYGLEVTAMVPFQPRDLQRGEWVEFKKKHAPQEVATR